MKTSTTFTDTQAISLLKKISDYTEVSDVIFPQTKFKWPNRTYRSLRFTHSDLGSPLVSPFMGMVGKGTDYIDCEFDATSLDGLNIGYSTFNNCTFVDCIIGKKYHGIFFKTTFNNCRFENCWFSAVQMEQCSIHNSQFLSIKGSKLFFQKCHITNCIYASKKMGIIHFIACNVDKTDMTHLNANDVYIASG